MIGSNNLILRTDSYKASHWAQYPKGTEKVYSYFESRGGEYQQTLFFGLQYYLKRYLTGQAINFDNIKSAEVLFLQHLGSPKIFNLKGWLHIFNEHGGHLPVEIKAVPEGTILPTRNVLFTVENTCPEDYWLTSYLETLLEKVWYPITIATKSYYLKQIIKESLRETGDDIPDFKLHDFGYRGASSEETAGIGDAAHLVNFKGTDTLAGIILAQDYYHAEEMPAFSVPAAEHSTITSWGRENEKKAYEHMLDTYPEGLVSVVSDSFDIYNAVGSIWPKLKDKVVKRKGTLVIRPDSGEPTEVLPKVFSLLEASFGSKTNEKGYKVLPSYLRVIQGDGIDEKTLPKVLLALQEAGWSADNIVFGSGGGLLQNVNRDTLRFAYKCSNVTINGEDHPVRKDPLTDPNKRSKAGRLVLYEVDDGDRTSWITENPSKLDDLLPNKLQTVFKDGTLVVDQTFDEIRKRANV